MSKAGGKWVKPPKFLEKIWLPDGATYDETKPDHFEAVCSDYFIFPDGHRAGQPIEWAPWQLDRIVRPIFGAAVEGQRPAGDAYLPVPGGPRQRKDHADLGCRPLRAAGS